MTTPTTQDRLDSLELAAYQAAQRFGRLDARLEHHGNALGTLSQDSSVTSWVSARMSMAIGRVERVLAQHSGQLDKTNRLLGQILDRLSPPTASAEAGS